MSATGNRTRRAVARRVARGAKRARPAASAKTAPKRAIAAPSQVVLYRLCKAGWAVTVERAPNVQGTRFVCPFCPVSHRVPGPVRGFRKMRRAQWVKLRHVES
ncbi:MAG: hypothetical protein WA871_04660 [Candidatus Acidiferrales bacterium]